MLLLSCHSYVSLLTFSGPQGGIKQKQILIRSEKYLMRYKKNFFPCLIPEVPSTNYIKFISKTFLHTSLMSFTYKPGLL